MTGAEGEVETTKSATHTDENDSEGSPTNVPPKRGIIYLSTIPPYMNVTRIREFFGQFGTVGRVYLQLAENDTNSTGKKELKKPKKKRRANLFSEGWVEFERKHIAKKVALLLNNKQVDTRKRSKQFDCLWNMKYLSGFKWTHLHERLAYEKAAKRQKLRAEIHLAKKKSDFFTSNVGKKKRQTVLNKELQDIDITPDEAPSSSKKRDIIGSLFAA